MPFGFLFTIGLFCVRLCLLIGISIILARSRQPILITFISPRQKGRAANKREIKMGVSGLSFGLSFHHALFQPFWHSFVIWMETNGQKVGEREKIDERQDYISIILGPLTISLQAVNGQGSRIMDMRSGDRRLVSFGWIIGWSFINSRKTPRT